MYEQIKLKVSENQKEKIQRAIKNNEEVTIRIDPNEEGNDVLALTNTQINKLKKGKPVNIKFSKSQLKHNVKIEGGFLAALARMALPLLKTAGPSIAKALGIGALTGLASTGVSKIFGDGIYLQRGGCLCQIETDGKGLYLSPVKGTLGGDGLYLRQEGRTYNGSGILGDLVKNIPLLNLIF